MKARQFIIAPSVQHGLELNIVLNGLAIIAMVAMGPAILAVAFSIEQVIVDQTVVVIFTIPVALVSIFVWMLRMNFTVKYSIIMAASCAVGGASIDFYFTHFDTRWWLAVALCAWLAIRVYSEGPKDHRLPE